jgi:secreted trypsin-like serine protease
VSFAAATFGCCLAIAGAASGAGPNQRIVGGDVADPGDWPFIAAVADRRGHQFCGGSVVDADSVVTAAHCAVGERPRDVHIITGRPDLDDEGDGQEIKVAEIKVHREYLRRGRRDVAVINLKDPTTAPAVALADMGTQASETTPGAEVRVAGWGGTERDGGSPSDILLDVALFTISDEDCSSHFNFFQEFEEVCAFGEQGLDGKYDDSCFGDSGGPLVADTPGDPVLVGIVSYGGPKCGVQKPGVYQEIGLNRNWIYRKANTP